MRLLQRGNSKSLFGSFGAPATTYRVFEESRRIHQLFGDSRSFDYAAHRGRMDLVLVDGCHLYDGVLRDSRNAFDMIRPGRIIVWHDFRNLYDVTRAVKFLAVQHLIFHVEGTSLAVHVREAQNHKAKALAYSEAFPGRRPQTTRSAEILRDEFMNGVFRFVCTKAIY